MSRKDTLDFLTVFSKSYVDMTKSNSENVLDILRNYLKQMYRWCTFDSKMVYIWEDNFLVLDWKGIS